MRSAMRHLRADLIDKRGGFLGRSRPFDLCTGLVQAQPALEARPQGLLLGPVLRKVRLQVPAVS
jgi:hypothetical protein